jgi:hypothetical protein
MPTNQNGALVHHFFFSRLFCQIPISSFHAFVTVNIEQFDTFQPNPFSLWKPAPTMQGDCGQAI